MLKILLFFEGGGVVDADTAQLHWEENSIHSGSLQQ